MLYHLGDGDSREGWACAARSLHVDADFLSKASRLHGGEPADAEPGTLCPLAPLSGPPGGVCCQPHGAADGNWGTQDIHCPWGCWASLLQSP